jgi:hypothetical protein
MGVRRPRLSGFSPEGDPYHYVLAKGEKKPKPPVGSGRFPAPHYVELGDGRKVSQWAPTKKSKVTGFKPAEDCDGHFMSSRFQPNNNCYNYACNIATNSFAIPGRHHQNRLVPPRKRLSAEYVIDAAQKDGLVLIERAPVPLESALKLLQAKPKFKHGHLVALLISKADRKIGWKGDFHWVRCDDPSGYLWSQKDGPDQVTDFDFAGKKIVDPSLGNWTVNQGPRRHRRNTPPAQIFEQRTVYTFEAWLFVPSGGVSII